MYVETVPNRNSPRHPPARGLARRLPHPQTHQAFRSLKSVDLKVRPIHHRLEERVRAHVLLCMLA